MTIELESQSAEKIPVRVTTSGDPSATPPNFAVTTTANQPSTWIAGEWDGAYDAATSEINALSPVAGDGQALDVSPGMYDLWIQWTIGTETPARQVDRLRVT